MTRPKITIVGAGNVGAQTAFLIATKGLGDLVLIDIDEKAAKGKALDLFESIPLLDHTVSVIGSTDYKLTKDSQIVVVTAGVPRKPGMSREDLIDTNAKIMTTIMSNVVKYSPDCILIIVTNPLDEMFYLAKRLSKFPRQRVLGMAGILDTTRFQAFTAQALEVQPQQVSALVLGGHADAMLPLSSLATVGGVPLATLLSSQKIQELIDRTRKAGGEIVDIMGTSAYYAPAASLTLMIESILTDQKKILPCCAELQGEYDQKGVFIGVPCVLGKKGMESIVEVPLSTEEKTIFTKTIEDIKTRYPLLNKYSSTSFLGKLFKS